MNRLDPFIPQLITVAGNIAAELATEVAEAPSQFTPKAIVNAVDLSTNMAYAIVHKILDDSASAEYEEFLGIGDEGLEVEDDWFVVILDPEFEINGQDV